MATLKRLQHALENEPGAVASAAAVLACVIVPTVIRLALQPVLGESLWFATYYPAVLCATVFLGWRLGLATLLSSALLADYFFIPPPLTLSLQKGDVAALLVYLFSGGIIVITAALLRQAIYRLNRAAETQVALNRELQHRVNNNLAVVQALAAQSIRSSPDPEKFYESFRGRLIALSAAQNVLSAGNWQTADFPELPQSALQPFAMDDRISMEGPGCSIPSPSCVPLVLALHELGTNASKYGALSVPEGRVLLRWLVRASQAGEELVLEWRECGGPAVRAPARQGLGSRLLAAQSGIRDVQTEFAPEGLRCTLVIEGVTTASRAVARAAGPAELVAFLP